MSRPATLLYIDPDPASRRAVGEAFDRAGLLLRSLGDPSQALAGVRVLKPDLVLVDSEVRGPVFARVLESLAADASAANLPIALLCEDTSEARFLHELRTGLVALLQKPFYAPRHIADVRSLLTELPRRAGAFSGVGDSRELTALVEHLRRTQRSGVLVMNARTPEEGRALFARGVLRSADHLGVHGVEALANMVASVRASWTFSEVGAPSTEVLIDLERTTGDHPFDPADDVPIVTGEPVGMDGGFPLEVGDVETSEEEIPIEPAASPAAGEPAGGAVRVLLVDDDEALCRMFEILFRKHGFEVATAQDGFAGYEAALARPFDMIVADLDMPRMDGWGMLRLIRDDFRTRELPVVFLSCHDDYRETLRALDAGALAYLSKATRLDTLATQVKALLAPRFEARRALRTAATAKLSPGTLGAQWLVREISAAGASGLLEAKDGWAHYRLTFRAGQPVHAFAQAGRHVAGAGKAFNAYVASRGAEGSFTRGDVSVTPNLTGTADALLEEAARVLNENERRLRDGLLVQASGIRVNDELYALYARVGPRPWLETARLICEERLPPREVIARVDASPIDVEETVRDLIRRGVVTLTA